MDLSPPFPSVSWRSFSAVPTLLTVLHEQGKGDGAAGEGARSCALYGPGWAYLINLYAK